MKNSVVYVIMSFHFYQLERIIFSRCFYVYILRHMVLDVIFKTCKGF